MTPYEYFLTFGRWPDSISGGGLSTSAPATGAQTAASQYGFGGNYGMNTEAVTNPYQLMGNTPSNTSGASSTAYPTTAEGAGAMSSAAAPSTTSTATGNTGFLGGIQEYGVPVASLVGAGANLYGAISGAQQSRRALAEQKRINQMYIDEFNLRRANREQTQQRYSNIYGD